MTDRVPGRHLSRTIKLRRLGWLGALMLLGAALLIPSTAALAVSPNGPCDCSTTSSTTTTDESTSSSTTTEDTTSTSTTTDETTSTSTTTDETTSTTTDQTSSTSTTTDETTSTSTSTTTTETGGVGGETGTPAVTPPSTNAVDGRSGTSGDAWRIILLALAGIAVLSLILVPGERKSRRG